MTHSFATTTVAVESWLLLNGPLAENLMDCFLSKQKKAETVRGLIESWNPRYRHVETVAVALWVAATLCTEKHPERAAEFAALMHKQAGELSVPDRDLVSAWSKLDINPNVFDNFDYDQNWSHMKRRAFALAQLRRADVRQLINDQALPPGCEATLLLSPEYRELPLALGKKPRWHMQALERALQWLEEEVPAAQKLSHIRAFSSPSAAMVEELTRLKSEQTQKRADWKPLVLGEQPDFKSLMVSRGEGLVKKSVERWIRNASDGTMLTNVNPLLLEGLKALADSSPAFVPTYEEAELKLGMKMIFRAIQSGKLKLSAAFPSVEQWVKENRPVNRDDAKMLGDYTSALLLGAIVAFLDPDRDAENAAPDRQESKRAAQAALFGLGVLSQRSKVLAEEVLRLLKQSKSPDLDKWLKKANSTSPLDQDQLDDRAIKLWWRERNANPFVNQLFEGATQGNDKAEEWKAVLEEPGRHNAADRMLDRVFSRAFGFNADHQAEVVTEKPVKKRAP